MRMRRYEDLLLWQKAMQLAKMVYLLQKGLPKEEIYGLGDQIRSVRLFKRSIAKLSLRLRVRRFTQCLWDGSVIFNSMQ